MIILQILFLVNTPHGLLFNAV